MTDEIAFPEYNAHRYQPTGTYTACRDRNGTEDEITIVTPTGELLAVIQFWDEPDTGDAMRAEADAKLIVEALNAFKHTDPKRMTTEQLEAHADACYSWHMRVEAASRGYNFDEGRQASDAWLKASVELKNRRKPKSVLDIAAEVAKAYDSTVAPVQHADISCDSAAENG